MGSKKNAWLKFDDAKKQEIFHFCEGYKKYISDCNTVSVSIKEAISLAEAKGYRDLKNVISTGESLKAGDKVYYNNMDKSLALFLIGSESIESGMRIIGSHVDSPRLDLKPNPLYEDSELSLMETHY